MASSVSCIKLEKSIKMKLTFALRTNHTKAISYFMGDFDRAPTPLPKPTWYESKPFLQLSGAVTAEAFAAILDNRHPVSGEKLTPRNNSVRAEGDRRRCYELTWSFSKSVSILSLIAEDSRIMPACIDAVHCGLDFAARFAAARVRRGGVATDRCTGHLLTPIIPHAVSRADDPHLHFHTPIANLTWDPEEERHKALQFEAILKQIKLIESWASAHLEHALWKLGYNIIPTDLGFEIAGVPAGLCLDYSSRTIEIESSVVRQVQLGVGVNPAQKKLIALGSRRTKSHLNWEDLLGRWKTKAGERIAAVKSAIGQALSREAERRGQDREVESAAAGRIAAVAREMLASSAAVTRNELLQHALVWTFGAFDGFSAERAIDAATRNGELVALPGTNALSIRQTLLSMGELIEKANASKARRVLPFLDLPFRRDKIVPELLIADDAATITILRISEAHESQSLLRTLFRDFGRRIALAAPAAVDSDGRKSDQVCAELQNGERSEIDTILISRSEHCTFREVGQCLDFASAMGLRLILSVASSALDDVDDHRPALELSRRSWLRVISPSSPPVIRSPRRTQPDTYERLLHRALTKKRVAVARRGVDLSTVADPAGTSYADNAATVAAVNAAFESRIRATGLGRDIVSYIPVNGPVVAGMALVAAKGTRNFAPGTAMIVMETRNDRVLMRISTNQTLELPTKAAAKLMPVKATPVHLAPGAKLELLHGYPPLGLRKGTIVTVEALNPDGSIRLQGGGDLPPWFRLFRQGYCFLLGTRKKGQSAAIVLSRRPSSTVKRQVMELSRAFRGQISILGLGPTVFPAALAQQLADQPAFLPPPVLSVWHSLDEWTQTQTQDQTNEIQ